MAVAAFDLCAACDPLRLKKLWTEVRQQISHGATNSASMPGCCPWGVMELAKLLISHSWPTLLARYSVAPIWARATR